jgi:hypothetical protein
VPCSLIDGPHQLFKLARRLPPSGAYTVVGPLDTELVEDSVHAHRMEVNSNNVPLKVSPPSFWGMLALC